MVPVSENPVLALPRPSSGTNNGSHCLDRLRVGGIVTGASFGGDLALCISWFVRNRAVLHKLTTKTTEEPNSTSNLDITENSVALQIGKQSLLQ